MSVFSLLLVVIIALLVIIPLARAMERTGWSWWWAILLAVPLVNVVVLWFWGLGRWPGIDLPGGKSARETNGIVDEWRRQQPDLPVRAEAARRLVEIGVRASKAGS